MTMEHIDALIDDLIAREGDYVHHPADRGGPTRWGITEAVARRHGYHDKMTQLPRTEAAAIYKRIYWHAPGFADVAAIAPKLAAELFDTGVNIGTGTATGFLQRALNALNRNGRDYADIAVDRKMGAATLSALSAFFDTRGRAAGCALCPAGRGKAIAGSLSIWLAIEPYWINHKEFIMSLVDGLIGPIASIIDKIIPDPKARDTAKLELLKLQGSQELENIKTQLSGILAEAQSADPWTSRARPSFLYVMYAMLLWAIPMGLISAVQPETTANIAAGMNAYLNGLPEPLYALFGTGYLGYTVARQWGISRGTEK